MTSWARSWYCCGLREGKRSTLFFVGEGSFPTTPFGASQAVERLATTQASPPPGVHSPAPSTSGPCSSRFLPRLPATLSGLHKNLEDGRSCNAFSVTCLSQSLHHLLSLLPEKLDVIGPLVTWCDQVQRGCSLPTVGEPVCHPASVRGVEAAL